MTENQNKSYVDETNGVANALVIIGILDMIIGCCGGLFSLGESAFIGIIVILSSIISGIMFLGFAEVIYLLQSIKSRVHIIAENTSSTAIVSKENTTNNISDELPDL